MPEISDVSINEAAVSLIEKLRERKLTFGTAESCTGGLIAKSVTDVPGCSDVFFGGVVSYDNSVKTGVLGVEKATLASVGAVSADTAMQMALGAKSALGVDVSVATTGIAGPGGGSDEKPVGLVYIAVCTEDDRLICEECRFSGTRDEIRRAACSFAIGLAKDNVG